jgi:hypothetical protein
MAQPTPTDVNTRVVDSAGHVTISASAMSQLGLGDGDRLIEFVLDGALVYIPVTADVTDAQDRFAQALEARGVTVENLLADIEQHKDEIYEALYGAPSS